MNPPDQTGQASLELVVTAALITLVITGAGWLFKLEWDRTRCAYLVFESAHARRSNRPGPSPRLEVRVTETAAAVRADGSCGSARLKVELPRLETLAGSR